MPMQGREFLSQRLLHRKIGGLELQSFQVDVRLAIHHPEVDNVRNPDLGSDAQFGKPVCLGGEHVVRRLRPGLTKCLSQ